MTQALTSSLGALLAQGARLQVSAENLANLHSLGAAKTPDGGDNGGFRPQRVELSSAPDGGVRARRVPITPASVRVFDPGDSRADAEGFINLFGLQMKVKAMMEVSDGGRTRYAAPDYSIFKRD